MSLLDFLTKWGLLEETGFLNLLAGFFERDIRTLQRWRTKTPGYARWVFKQISENWEASGGKNYRIFFDC